MFGFSSEATAEEIVTSRRLISHASRFMDAMRAAVEHLCGAGAHEEPLDRLLAPVFINLGKHHVHFTGLDDSYFAVFSGAMMYVWRETLGDRFTGEVRAAWSRLFDFILQHLEFGYHLAVEDRRDEDTAAAAAAVVVGH